MRVKAAVARAYHMPLVIETLDLAEPGPGDILVRLVASGIGRVDREAIAGTMAMPLPFVPGSEGAGFVERVGDDVVDIEPGDAVLVDYAACRTCPACLAGHPRACIAFAAQNLAGRRPGQPAPFKNASGEVNGFFFGQSSFATHVVCRAEHTIRLPTDMPLEIAAALGGECLLGPAAVMEVFRLRPGDVIAIAGAGLVGLVACMVAKAQGARAIIIAEPDAKRRALAAACGATVAVHADADLATAVRSMAGEGANFALETTGSATGRKACRDSLHPHGIIGATRPAWDTSAEPAGRDGKSIVAVDRGVDPRALIPDLVDLYVEGRLKMDRLITFFPLASVNEALAATVDGRCVKAVLRFPLGAFDDLDRARSGSGTIEVPEPTPANDDPTSNDDVTAAAEDEHEPAKS